MNRNGNNMDVLTLAEAAKFLRTTEAAVAQLAVSGAIPARRIGKEWRFLRAAVVDWLRGTESSYDRLRRQIGALAGDETIPELLRTIYAERKKSKPKGRVTA